MIQLGEIAANREKALTRPAWTNQARLLTGRQIFTLAPQSTFSFISSRQLTGWLVGARLAHFPCCPVGLARLAPGC